MDPNEDAAQDWITAMEAAQFLAKRFGGLSRAQHSLAIGLREGLITAAAEFSAICEEEDGEFVEEKCSAEELLGIPTEVWARSGNWESDRLRWDWELGDFEIENLDEDSTYLFQGVHFLESDILTLDPETAIFNITDNSLARAVRMEALVGRRRGPKPAYAKWSALIESVLFLERDGKLLLASTQGRHNFS